MKASGLAQGYLVACFSFIAGSAVEKSQCHFWSLNSSLQGLASKLSAMHSHSFILAVNPYTQNIYLAGLTFPQAWDYHASWCFIQGDNYKQSQG